MTLTSAYLERVEDLVGQWAAIPVPWITVDMVWRATRAPKRWRTKGGARTIVAVIRARGYSHLIQRGGRGSRWLIPGTHQEDSSTTSDAEDDVSTDLLRRARRLIRGSGTLQRKLGLPMSVLLAEIDRELDRRGIARTEAQP